MLQEIHFNRHQFVVSLDFTVWKITTNAASSSTEKNSKNRKHAFNLKISTFGNSRKLSCKSRKKIRELLGRKWGKFRLILWLCMICLRLLHPKFKEFQLKVHLKRAWEISVKSCTKWLKRSGWKGQIKSEFNTTICLSRRSCRFLFLFSVLWQLFGLDPWSDFSDANN